MRKHIKSKIICFQRYESVEATLSQNELGMAVIRAARNCFSEGDRRVMIRMVVAELVAAQNEN